MSRDNVYEFDNVKRKKLNSFFFMKVFHRCLDYYRTTVRNGIYTKTNLILINNSANSDSDIIISVNKYE